MFENHINYSVRQCYQLKCTESILNSFLEEFVYESTEYLRCEIKYLHVKKVFKEQFKEFREDIKNELGNKGVDNQFEKENKREINKYRGFDMER